LIWAQFQNGLARPLSGNLQIDSMPSAPQPEPVAPAPASSSAAVPQPATAG
jgi:hypothetical protein